MKYLLLLVTLQFSITATSQSELLEIEGAIKLSNTTNAIPQEGTIRWNGIDFQGWNGTNWISLSGNSDGIVTDIEGNSYETVEIGSEIWMSENLKTTKYNDGSPIDSVILDSNWSSNTTGAWCYYNNDPTLDSDYGKLYNWHAVNTKNLCPIGWHVPTDIEWTEMINFIDPITPDPESLGFQSLTVGNLLKETGLDYWSFSSSIVTNESGWNGRGGGFRNVDGTFFDFQIVGSWWSLTTNGGNTAVFRSLFRSVGNVTRGNTPKTIGASVRCIKN